MLWHYGLSREPGTSAVPLLEHPYNPECPLARESPAALDKRYLTAAIALSTHGPAPPAGRSRRRGDEVDGTGYC